jgi:hypothetical protein
MAQLPALEIEGEYLFGCAAISRYLNYCNTNTADKSEHAQIAQVQIHTDSVSNRSVAGFDRLRSR